RGGEVVGNSDVPAARRANLLDGCAGVDRIEPHLAGLVEVVDAEIGDDDARATSEPSLLAPDSLALVRPAEVAGAGAEVDRVDEAARALAHDDEHLSRVDGDLARATAPGETGGRVVVLP